MTLWIRSKEANKTIRTVSDIENKNYGVSLCYDENGEMQEETYFTENGIGYCYCSDKYDILIEDY